MQPHGIDIPRARREAKALLAAARRGDTAVLVELRRDRPPMLADALRAIARRYGFRSWTELLSSNRDRGWQLRDAARRGDDDTLYELLDEGADANSADPRTGRTALHEAAAADQLSTVVALVGWIPADKRRGDRHGRTALHLARPGSPVVTVLERFESGVAEAMLTSSHATLSANTEVALLDHLSRAPGVERWRVGDGFGFRTGLDDNTRNGVIAQRATESEVTDALTRLRGCPATWHSPSAAFTPELGAALGAAGGQPERNAVHMHAALSSLGVRRDHRVVEVTDPGLLTGIDVGEAALLLAAGAPLRAFTLDGVATAVTFTAGTTVLGMHLYVARAQRRRGLARALVQHITGVQREAGCVDAIIGPTTATIPLYERLGFTLERSEPERCYYLPT